MLTIVIPVYNEGENIKIAVSKIQNELKYPFKINLIYDDDNDLTIKAASGLNVNLIKNKYGKGALNAIKTGLETADTEYVVVTMADLSDPPSVINKMVENAQTTGAAIVCGSRYMKGGKQNGGPFLKGLLSKMAGLSLHYLGGIKTHDATNSFKLYRKSFLDKVKIESTGGFELGLELVIKAHKMGEKITEVPTTWEDRVAGKSNFKLLKWLPCYLKWYFGALNSFFYYLLMALFFLTVSFSMHAYEAAALDTSWVWALDNIIRNGEYIFGKDVFFTYGPLGFLFAQLEGSSAPCILFNYFLLSLFLFAFYCLRKKPKALTWLLIFYIFSFSMKPSVEFLAPLLCYVGLISKEKQKIAAYSLMGLISATMLFVKFNYGAIFISTLFVSLILDKFNKKAVIPAGLTFGGFITFFILFYFKGLEAFINWFNVSLEIGAGYCEAMAMGNSIFMEFFWWIVPLVAIIIFLKTVFSANNKREGAALFFLFLPGIFFAYKAAVVRTDLQHMAIFSFFMIYVFLFLFFIKNKFSLKKLVCIIIFLLLPVGLKFEFRIPFIDFYKQRVNISDIYVLPDRWLGEIKNSTVECLPFNMLYIVKNHLHPHYNPILQLYSVYTPKLDEISAQNYIEKKTDYIILDYAASIEGRRVVFDAPITISAIKENYQVVDFADNKILLKKRQTAAPKENLAVFSKTKHKMNEKIEVPNNAKAAIVDIGLSGKGKIAKILYRIPQIKFNANVESKSESFIYKGKIIRTNKPLHVEYFIKDLNDLNNFLQNKPVNNKIKEIVFRTYAPAFYKEEFEIKWLK